MGTMPLKKVVVLIVTFNSQRVLHKAIESLQRQTYPIEKLILIDTGSDDIAYLLPYKEATVIYGPKYGGFCLGNNLGFQAVPHDCDYLLLLNPDAFLFNDFIEKAVLHMEGNPKLGGVTGITYGYDLSKDAPTGYYDTTGIFPTWYGRWFDRGQGVPVSKNRYARNEYIPAICGAVFFLRKRALDEILLPGKNIFNNKFHMYKEDIDLSLRLARRGWKLLFAPDLEAYHCRGWQGKRGNIPKYYRLISAKNELVINFSRKNPLAVVYSVLKWGAVKFFNI